jgi:hypothetical protein
MKGRANQVCRTHRIRASNMAKAILAGVDAADFSLDGGA